METVQGYVHVRNFHSILDQLHLQLSDAVWYTVCFESTNKNQDT